eukprot:Opistho-1_new@89870
MATYLPLTFDGLRRISGFGDYKVSKYGPAFMKVLQTYANENTLESKIQLKVPKKERAAKPAKETTTISNTQRISFDLFKDGYDIADIAQKRNLSTNTIETHLLPFVTSGELNATKLVDKTKLAHVLCVD